MSCLCFHIKRINDPKSPGRKKVNPRNLEKEIKPFLSFEQVNDSFLRKVNIFLGVASLRKKDNIYFS